MVENIRTIVKYNNYTAAKLLMIHPSERRICIVRSGKKWSLPGGKRDKNEIAPWDTLLRELKEELDIHLHDKKLAYLGVSQIIYEEGDWINIIFAAVASVDTFKLCNEIVSLKWVEPDLLSDYTGYYNSYNPLTQIAYLIDEIESIRSGNILSMYLEYVKHKS